MRRSWRFVFFNWQGGDQNDIRATRGESFSSRQTSIKKPAGYSPAIRMLRNLKVLLGQTVSTAGIQMDQTACQRAFADGFHDNPAGNITAVSDHTRDDCVLTP